MPDKLLLIEDTATLQMIYGAYLQGAGYDVDVASTGVEGTELFRKNNNSVVIMDLFLPDLDGVDIIKQFVQINPQVKIIVITSNGSVNRAVEAMRAGAFDFLLKPFTDERLLATVAAALASFQSGPETNLEEGRFHDFIGRGSVMQEMYSKIIQVAPSTAPVFLVGECGFTTDTCASAIHTYSDASSGKLVAFNAKDIDGFDQEKALFGEVKNPDGPDNTFENSALQDAYGGTLYINEISALDPSIQSKLNRLLQTASLRDKYVNEEGKAFPRVVCSSSIDPFSLLEMQKIREDLFYQLHIHTIDIPMLRQVGDDIIFIAENILRKLSSSEKKSFAGFTHDVSNAFLAHNWPGNINQLRNLLHKIVVNNDAVDVTIDMLPYGFASLGAKTNNDTEGRIEAKFITGRNSSVMQELVGLQLEEVEQKFIEATIYAQGGSIPKAAEMLGVAPSTIYRKRSKP